MSRGIALAHNVALERYLKGLIQKHRALDDQIRAASRPEAVWSPSLAQLKRLRLTIKDRIVAIQREKFSDPDCDCSLGFPTSQVSTDDNQ